MDCSVHQKVSGGHKQFLAAKPLIISHEVELLVVLLRHLKWAVSHMGSIEEEQRIHRVVLLDDTFVLLGRWRLHWPGIRLHEGFPTGESMWTNSMSGPEDLCRCTILYCHDIPVHICFFYRYGNGHSYLPYCTIFIHILSIPHSEWFGIYIYIYARRTWSAWVWFWFAFDSKMPLLQSGQKGCPSGQKQKGTNKTPINFTLAPQDFQIFCERSGVFSGASWRKPSPSAEASPKHSTTPSDRETLNIRSHSHRPHHDLCAKNQWGIGPAHSRFACLLGCRSRSCGRNSWDSYHSLSPNKLVQKRNLGQLFKIEVGKRSTKQHPKGDTPRHPRVNTHNLRHPKSLWNCLC